MTPTGDIICEHGVWRSLCPICRDFYKNNINNMKEEKNRSCPCLYLDEPCHPDCTCIKPFSSRGCRYCCSYGSEEQKIEKAKYLKSKIDGKTDKEESIDSHDKKGNPSC